MRVDVIRFNQIQSWSQCGLKTWFRYWCHGGLKTRFRRWISMWFMNESVAIVNVGLSNTKLKVQELRSFVSLSRLLMK